MNTKPILSIIVPVHNVSDYIENCIRSVLSQSAPEVELILVDDHSSDDSLHKAQKLLSQSDLMYKIVQHEQNRGVSVSRNDGVAAASGQYIFFLDSDDWLATGAVDVMLNAIRKYQTPIIGFNAHAFVDGKDTGLYLKDFGHWGLHHFPDSINLLLKGQYPFFCLWLCVFRRDIFNAVHFPEGSVHEDSILMPEVLAIAKDVYLENIPIYNYRIRSGSIMRSFQPQTRHVASELMAMRQRLFALYPELADALLQYYSKTLRDIAGLVAQNSKEKNAAVGILKCWLPYILWSDIRQLRTTGRRNMAVFMLLFKCSPSILVALFRKGYLGKNQ